MPDIEDDGFNDETFKGLGDDPAPVKPPTDPATPPVTPPAEPPKEEPKPAEEPKKNEEPAKKPEETPPAPAADEKKPQEGDKPPETPETPPVPEEPKPLTKGDVESVVSNLLNNERISGKELDTTAKEVLEAYYPDGLSNVLIDEKSGKELRTPQDVIDASGGELAADEAAQWLMNEQYKLDNQVAKIRSDAREIAETTVNFRRDSMTVLQKYEPLFKAYPTIQKKVFDKLMEQVKVDKDRGVILSAPDVMGHYDFYLEPYQQAFEYSTKQSATNPTPPPGGEPKKPTAEDRMDEGGDGGVTAPNDPNDFAQQVTKELAKGIQEWKTVNQKASAFSILRAVKHTMLDQKHRYKLILIVLTWVLMPRVAKTLAGDSNQSGLKRLRNFGVTKPKWSF